MLNTIKKLNTVTNTIHFDVHLEQGIVVYKNDKKTR